MEVLVVLFFLFLFDLCVQYCSEGWPKKAVVSSSLKLNI